MNKQSIRTSKTLGLVALITLAPVSLLSVYDNATGATTQVTRFEKALAQNKPEALQLYQQQRAAISHLQSQSEDIILSQELVDQGTRRHPQFIPTGNYVLNGTPQALDQLTPNAALSISGTTATWYSPQATNRRLCSQKLGGIPTFLNAETPTLDKLRARKGFLSFMASSFLWIGIIIFTNKRTEPEQPYRSRCLHRS